MNVRLVSLTESLITEEKLSPEELIVYIARVSNPSNQLNKETSDKLIRYLIKNKHWSPMEMVDMTVEVETSRAIAAQILRHWSFSFQEFSQRYAEVTDMEPVMLRKQAETNRQSSVETIDDKMINLIVENHIKASKDVYKFLLNNGAAKECARMVLPLTTQTKIYMKGSIRDWIHYLETRCGTHTQLEHRLVAFEIKKIFMDKFPMISKALDYHVYNESVS